MITLIWRFELIVRCWRCISIGNFTVCSIISDVNDYVSWLYFKATILIIFIKTYLCSSSRTKQFINNLRVLFNVRRKTRSFLGVSLCLISLLIINLSWLFSTIIIGLSFWVIFWTESTSEFSHSIDFIWRGACISFLNINDQLVFLPFSRNWSLNVLIAW